MEKLKAGIYCRVADKKDSQKTLEAQEFYATKACDENGFKIVDTYKESKSALHLKGRYEYKRMLADLEGGKINIVVTKELATLTRSTKDWQILVKMLHRVNGKIYICSENGYYSENKELMADIVAFS